MASKKQTANRWDLSNWSSGEVTLWQALGFGQAKIQYPKFMPQFTQNLLASQAQQSTSQSKGGDSGGGSNAPTGPPKGPVGKGHLSYQGLRDLWINAGGAPAASWMAAAIAEAESGGNQNASNTNTNGSIDRGYWQINSSHGSLSTFDPLGNARAAISISSNGTNWQPWVTYQTGAYKQFLQSPSTNPPSGSR